MKRLRVILVRPRIAANLGAVARAMRNFGASDLYLVSPEADVHDPRGRLLATHSEEILDRAHIVDELGEACADCLVVVGTSARTGGLFRRQSVASPEQIGPLLAQGFSEGPAALVFGPESTGLTDAEVTRCHHLLRIPTDSGHPALNLAQAVAIALYVVHNAWSQKSVRAEATTESEKKPANFGLQEQMLKRLQAGLEAIHFLYGEKAAPLMHAIRHILYKAKLTDMEVKVLLGLARQMHWIADARGAPGETR